MLSLLTKIQIFQLTPCIGFFFLLWYINFVLHRKIVKKQTDNYVIFNHFKHDCFTLTKIYEINITDSPKFMKLTFQMLQKWTGIEPGPLVRQVNTIRKIQGAKKNTPNP